MKIYLARNNVQAGPYTLDELNRMLILGEVALTDLMWHAGMNEWLPVGQMTGGVYTYQPSVQTPPSPTPPTAKPKQRGFGDNVDMVKDESKPKRISVAELYGRKPIQDPNASQNDEPNRIESNARPTKERMASLPKDDGTIEYASILARFSAFVINVGLYILALLPLIMAFMQVVDVNEIARHAQDYQALQVYSQSLANKVSNTTIMISNLMLLALLGIQSLLIIMRGQSFGKLVMGIRVVDIKTGKLPSFGTLVFMRTLFLIVLYVIGASVMSGLPAMIMLGANYIMAKGNDKKQGWHDKMTKTLTVKAKPSQLDKTK